MPDVDHARTGAACTFAVRTDQRHHGPGGSEPPQRSTETEDR